MSRSLKSNPYQFFPTLGWATDILINEIKPYNPRCCFEPCAGDGAISNKLRDAGLRVLTNDIDTRHETTFMLDAKLPDNWRWFPHFDWAITNPPFNCAAQIIPNAVARASMVPSYPWGVAMLLRITYLEPCKNRAQWLIENPIKRLIVLPRMSFTGDRKTDSVTCAWFIWGSMDFAPIKIVQPKILQRALSFEVST
jgi:hypothetical protein